MFIECTFIDVDIIFFYETPWKPLQTKADKTLGACYVANFFYSMENVISLKNFALLNYSNGSFALLLEKTGRGSSFRVCAELHYTKNHQSNSKFQLIPSTWIIRKTLQENTPLKLHQKEKPQKRKAAERLIKSQLDFV